ncbi:MAG TPA: prolyl oligopeptidase family serine peptidase [Pyrinomonadaceae bacterium]|nr:prolyl oligopeptidase family serine peptidase [Pyrinomonadaceae bacterium]
MSVGQKQLTPLPIKEAFKTFNLPRFTPIDLSPDGRLVAYVLHDPTRDAESKVSRSPEDLERKGIPRGVDHCDIWISDTTTGTIKNLTEGQGTNWAPVWSPSGQYLAFYSDRDGVPALWIWEKTSGAIRRASKAIVRTRLETTTPLWTPDSKKLVIRVLSEGMTLRDAEALLNKPSTETGTAADTDKEPGSTVVLFRAKAPNATGNAKTQKAKLNNNLIAYAADLAVVDLETKTTKRIANRIVSEGYWLSPNGKQVAVLVYKGRQSHETLQSLFDLLVISLINGESKTVVSDFGSDVLIPVSWSPDGKFLAYMTAGPTVKNDCWIVPAAGGEPRNISRGEHPFFENTFIYRGPLWDASGAKVYLLSATSLWRASVSDGHVVQFASIPGRILKHIISHNGRTIWTPNDENTIVVMTRAEETKQEGFYKIDLVTGKTQKLLEENKSYGFAPSLRTGLSSDQRLLVYTSQSAAEPEDIWSFNVETLRPQRITHLNPLFDRFVMGEGRLIEWRTLNGQTAHGALLLPAGYTPGKRYPLIVYQYPGAMWSNYGNLFGFNPYANAVENWQFFATRGYAVLLPDVPAKPETYMRDIAAAVLPAVDKVIQLGICDPERIGITGQSNGGYGVLSLIVQTNRFKAAVDRMGPGNLISQYLQMTDTGVSVYTGEMVQRTGGSLWEKRDKFIENSPIFYFDRVQTPLLIIQGTGDRQVTVARSDEVFVSLRFLDKEVEYARYAGEPHGVTEWSFPNQVDYLNRVIAWFDRWLKR